MPFVQRFAKDKARFARGSDCGMRNGRPVVQKSVTAPGKTLHARWVLVEPVVFASEHSASVKVLVSSAFLSCSQRVVHLERQEKRWIAISDEDTGLEC
ncbi:hypothetical protein FGE12_28030 [Aggregicoccus sp. 17bor-14]|uniref:hypothetical protein n=1 Tax=Myxococcaceae TaxID=31 RepID=UPI00129CCE66|nr:MULTISPECIES: hypothetical protein [Myxococcaceae]MBF5046297.1 hypothetical protein [Simulacricoccus sp. 17bor-14]MRI92019.1 hypothetical protein [Aggregicoccus sp. 17bor-14]